MLLLTIGAFTPIWNTESSNAKDGISYTVHTFTADDLALQQDRSGIASEVLGVLRQPPSRGKAEALHQVFISHHNLMTSIKHRDDLRSLHAEEVQLLHAELKRLAIQHDTNESTGDVLSQGKRIKNVDKSTWCDVY